MNIWGLRAYELRQGIFCSGCVMLASSTEGNEAIDPWRIIGCCVWRIDDLFYTRSAVASLLKSHNN